MKTIVENIFFSIPLVLYFHGYWFFSVTLEDLKRQADKFGLKRKDRTKYKKEEWQKIQDAKKEKKRFEKEEKRFEKEADKND